MAHWHLPEGDFALLFHFYRACINLTGPRRPEGNSASLGLSGFQVVEVYCFSAGKLLSPIKRLGQRLATVISNGLAPEPNRD